MVHIFMNWLDSLLSVPRVCEFFIGEEWSCDLAPQFLDRGRLLSDGGKVLNIDHFIGSQSGFVATARVQGSRVQPYKVHLNGRFEKGSWVFWGECACPVGDDCKHVAAVVYDLQKAIRAADTEMDGASDHQFWLNSLTSVLGHDEKPKKEPKKQTRQTAALAYLVTLRDDGLLRMGFGKIAYPPNKRPPRVENASLSPNIRTRVPAYFQEGDAELTFALQNRIPKAPDSNHYWYEVRVLKGPYAESILPQMLETERVFLADEFTAARLAPFPNPIKAGPSLALAPQWEVSVDGDCTPSIGLPSKRVRLIEVEGSHYLDLEKHLLGPVELAAGHSLALLRAWLSGPTITASAAARLTAEMEERGIPVVLPRPVTLEEKELKHDGVTVVLSFFRGPILKSIQRPVFGGTTQVAAQPLIGATLSFRYADRELEFTPSFPKSSRVASRDHLLVVKRDVKSEKLALTMLEEIDILPAQEIFKKEFLNEKYQECFGINDEVEDWDFVWANHLAVSVPTLEEIGWEIRYDESFDLSVTEAEEMFTDLSEDTAKGIDWFQFDTGIVTTEGQRQSLMELIANFLRTNDDIPGDDTLDDDQRVLVTDKLGKSFFNLPARRFFRIVRSVRDLFDRPDDGLHRLEAATIAEELQLDDSKTLADLRALGEQLKKKEPHVPVKIPSKIKAELRDYQKDGFQWLQFLARHHLHGILADDMGLGKTLQALTHIVAEIQGKRHEGKPSFVVAPTSVVPNWAAEAKRFAPSLKILVLHGVDRQDDFKKIEKSDLVITSYALLQRDQVEHRKHSYHLALLDEAQYIKNPNAKVSIAACKLDAKHRVCLSGTPMENHLGELWSLTRFLMPGLLGTQDTFNKVFRTPIERHRDADAQRALNARVGNLILRRTKDQVVLELPAKTEIIHRIPLNKEQQEIYESVRTAMDSKVRDAIADKGLARSQIIVLDALLKLRQVCCHPQLIKTEISKKAKHSAKLDFLVELLATLIEEGRRILLFSQFTTMLAMIEEHLKKEKIKYVKITGATRDRKTPVEEFQAGGVPVFLISLKAGGTGLNLTAADTVIHYDPWWNPAAENQATDRAHRIGQTQPVFVHKLVCEGSIEERILELQARKSKLVEALLSQETTKLRLDTGTLENLLSPIG